MTTKLIDQLSLREDSSAPEQDRFFERYGLLRNPFPPSRTIIPEVLYDQETAYDQFVSLVREFLKHTTERRSMGILGGTGGGKTHFLRHCRWRLQELCRESHYRFVFVEFAAGAGKVQDIVREAFRGADTLCNDHCGADFIASLLSKLQETEDSGTILKSIQHDELRSALNKLLGGGHPGYQLPNTRGQYGAETLRELFRRWLHGGTLSQTERKHLGVFSRIATASVASRVLREMFTLAKSLQIIHGMFLCLDEIETLFTGGLRPAQYQAFLQDLRYLYDEAVKDASGYSLLVLTASTNTGANTLLNINYPVYQRLGFEQPMGVTLVPINGQLDARNFANVYIEYGHEEWKNERKAEPSSDPKTLLTDSDIMEVYDSVLRSTDSEMRKGGQVNQAPLLDAFFRKVEAKRPLSRQ